MDMIRPLKTFSLFVTENCNLDCDYCFFDKRDKKEISVDTAQRAVDFFLEQSKDENNLHLSFWGGEPLLSLRLIKRLVDYTTRKAQMAGKTIHYSMPTNCTAFNEDALDFIKSRNISLSLSIDGTRTSQSLRRTVKGHSSYHTVKENLKLIEMMGVSHLASVRKTVTPDTVVNLHKDILFFLDHGLRRITFSPVMETEWPEKKLEIFEEQQLKIADHWIRSLSVDEPFSIKLWDEMLIERIFSKRPELFCEAGVSVLAADVNGHLFPCHRFVYYDHLNHIHCLGDIHTGIKEDSLYMMYNAITHETLMARTEDCTTCPHTDRCRLFCPAINYKLTGDALKNEPWLCRFEMICESVVEYIAEKMSVEKKFAAYLAKKLKDGPRYRLSEKQIDKITGNAHRTLAVIRREKQVEEKSRETN